MFNQVISSKLNLSALTQIIIFCCHLFLVYSILLLYLFLQQKKSHVGEGCSPKHGFLFQILSSLRQVDLNKIKLNQSNEFKRGQMQFAFTSALSKSVFFRIHGNRLWSFFSTKAENSPVV